MKIFFTNKAFQEEIYRRMEAKEEADYVRRRLMELNERIEGLYMEIRELKCDITDRPRKEE